MGVLGPKDADIEPDITDMTSSDGSNNGDVEPREIAPVLLDRLREHLVLDLVGAGA